MTGSLATRRTRRRRLIAWLAAVCLAFGWAHVWLHDAGHDKGLHFRSEATAQCQLAKLHWQILPEPPSCAARLGFDAPSADEPRIAFARAATRRPGVRAPPLS